MDEKQAILTPEQEAIQALSAILSAIFFETEEVVTKQIINMLVAQVAQEYNASTHDPLSVALFTPEKLTREFRNAIAIMRQSMKETRLFKMPGKNGSHKD